MLVARNENLSAISFQSLAEAMPKDDQQCDKTYILYRTIDIYLNVWNFEVGLKEKNILACIAIEYMCHGYDSLAQRVRDTEEVKWTENLVS